MQQSRHHYVGLYLEEEYVGIGSTLWCEAAKRTNIWQQAFFPMQVLQDYVQRQEYIILPQDDELVPWVH
jgi:hypothetical protein